MSYYAKINWSSEKRKNNQMKLYIYATHWGSEKRTSSVLKWFKTVHSLNGPFQQQTGWCLLN